MEPRISQDYVYIKALKQIYAQIIDDTDGKVLSGVSTLNKEIKAEVKYGGNMKLRKRLVSTSVKRHLALGLMHVVFDRNGFKYHGRIKALADGAREAGLIF